MFVVDNADFMGSEEL